MTVAYETSFRGWPSNSHPAVCLEDKFEIIKDIGDGSFGSVALGRTRSAGAHIVRRNTLVAIKTMKKTFDNFAQCMELREVIFLKTLPSHVHLVPAYDIFLDPLSRKLHIAMEYMDGNLYQLMKARDHKPFDASSVKSILFQILGGLEHIHDHHFFHRDIKPENILVSTSAPDTGSAFKRYSSLVTPPSTPPTYSIKLADFGLARETYSRVPYTTYVSTRWYRAPEVLLRAGEYSAPVDIWAVGAMAVEVATLRPLFPGGNEVDQVWRVCETMGSPGVWVNKHNERIGGGEWKDGIRLAQKLGFSFPKMAPRSLDNQLPSPQWPASLVHFVTWCLMWDPKVRPTSRQALEHEYFIDATDPLRPKSSSTSRLLNRKSIGPSTTPTPEEQAHALPTKTSSWFRKSLPARESLPPPVPVHIQPIQLAPERPSPVHATTTEAPAQVPKARPANNKRATWANGATDAGAPIPILPSIRPVSPIHNAATAQATSRAVEMQQDDKHKKIGRQLSVNSQGNHYADLHRQEAERALNGVGLKSPTSSSHRESFFSHLRKRARRLSGRHQLPMSPNADDVEASAGCAPWQTSNSARQSGIYEPPQAIAPSAPDPAADPNFAELDRALQSVRYSLDTASQQHQQQNQQQPGHLPQQPHRQPVKVASTPLLKRHHSLPYGMDGVTSSVPTPASTAFARTRKSVRHSSTHHRYETPDEEDELLDEALASAHTAARRLDHDGGSTTTQSQQHSRAPSQTQQKVVPAPTAAAATVATRPPPPAHVMSDPGYDVHHHQQQQQHYLTPSPSKDHMGGEYDMQQSQQQQQQQQQQATGTKPVDIPSRQQYYYNQQKHGGNNGHTNGNGNGNNGVVNPHWPTPPYEENDWASSAAASIFATQEMYR